ncbi:MAG TPA: alpha/beta hydrolase [Bacteroidales bacterium]|nr:alpha/beta hydrolase [Bacteroidales bacterium]
MQRFLSVILFSVMLMPVAYAGGIRDGIPVPVPSKPYENSCFYIAGPVMLHYRIWNDTLSHPRGKVILIHGFSGSTFCWRKNIKPLVDAGFLVVAVDLPSFGYSERDPELNQSNSNRARLLWQLLSALDGGEWSSWNIAGHSMGGGVAEAMAILEPARTRSLTIVSGMVFQKSSNLINTVSFAGRNRHVSKFLVELTEEKALTYKSMSRLLKSAYGRSPDSAEVMGYLTPLLIEGTAEAALGIFTRSDEVVRMNIDSLGTIPVHILWGSKDKWIKIGVGKKFHEAVRGSEMEIIPGAGHILIETHPEEFNRLFVPWLIKQNPLLTCY